MQDVRKQYYDKAKLLALSGALDEALKVLDDLLKLPDENISILIAKGNILDLLSHCDLGSRQVIDIRRIIVDSAL